MCGILGTTNPNTTTETFFTSCKTIHHRGPDYTGSWESPNIHLGHTLLSIRGEPGISIQPYKENKNWILIFNGQIYNTKQLIDRFAIHESDPQKRALDTHILYKLIEKLGWDFASHIQGMYAIALYHVPSQKLRLYRDKSGQKPLYYQYDHINKLVFASELKSILQITNNSKPKTDYEALDIATSLGYIPGDKTLIEGIKKILPGECLEYDTHEQKITGRHWITPITTIDYYSEDFDSAINQLVTEHLQSKQQVSINLSGGIDSSLLLHLAHKNNYQLQTFTTKFAINGDEKTYNQDAALAEKLATDYNTKHETITITSDDYLKNLIDAYQFIEEPNYNVSNPIYLITAKHEGKSGNGLRVVFSGDGGDEIFGGYPVYREAIKLKQYSKFLTPLGLSYIKNKRNHTDFDFTNPIGRWLFWKTLGTYLRKKPYSAHTMKYLSESLHPDNHSKLAQRNTPFDCMVLDRAFWMANEVFIRSDKLYMSQSMEMRCPFAYEPFRDYVDRKLSNTTYLSKETNKKFIRHYAEGKLPDYITHRQNKTGWRAPVDIWYNQQYKKTFLELVDSQIKQHTRIDWEALHSKIASSEKWPAKNTHLYLSLATLANKFNLEL